MFSSIVSNLNKLFLFGLLGIIFFLFDLYAWQAFKTISRDWSAKTRTILFYSYWILSLSFVLMIILRPYIELEKLGSTTLILVQVFGVILFIAKFFAALPLLLEDAFRGIEWLVGLFGKNSAENIMSERRKFISITSLTVGALPLIGMTWGLIKGAHNYKTRKLNLTFNELPLSFDGIKIVQLSDIHSGSFWDRKAVEKGIKKVMDLKPDVIFFTGDLVNNKAEEMESWKELFGSLKAPLGVYSILGNHDYGDYVSWNSIDDKIKNLEKLKSIHAEMGWNLLNNQAVSIEKNGESIEVLGVENWSAKGNFPKYGSLTKAIESSSNSAFQILLSHDPSHWKAEVLKASKNIKLTLSGHTHGFQFGIETHGWQWSPVKYMYPEWAGKYEKDGQYLYVNRGFGYIGYPGRIGIDPEITLITLQKS